MHANKMILSWTFLESYWKFDIRDIVWYLNFLLVILSIKNLVKSNNNNLNLTALFYRELQITFHIISIKSYACSWLIDKFNCKVVFNYNCVVSNHKRDVHDKVKPLFNIWIFLYRLSFYVKLNVHLM